MRTLGMCLALLALSSAVATAQTAAPANAPAPAPAAASPASAAAQQPAPAAAQPAPAAAQPAAAPGAAATAPAPEATAAPAEQPAEGSPAAQDAALSETERQRREADRARIRLLLARARAERAALDPGTTAAAPGARPAPQPEAKESPTPYRADDAGAAIAVGLSLEFPWHTGNSFDLFSADDVGERFGLWATHDLLAFGDRTFLAAGVGFDVESVDSANLFAGALDTELTATVLYATTQLRYALTDWLQPHARLSLGAQLVETELDLNGTDYTDDGELPFGSLGAGLTLRTPNRTFESRRNHLAALSFGLMIEAGYTVAAPLEMSLDGPGPDDRDIPLIEPALADLDRSGPFLRFSLVARL